MKIIFRPIDAMEDARMAGRGRLGKGGVRVMFAGVAEWQTHQP